MTLPAPRFRFRQALTLAAVFTAALVIGIVSWSNSGQQSAHALIAANFSAVPTISDSTPATPLIGDTGVVTVDPGTTAAATNFPNYQWYVDIDNVRLTASGLPAACSLTANLPARGTADPEAGDVFCQLGPVGGSSAPADVTFTVTVNTPPWSGGGALIAAAVASFFADNVDAANLDATDADTETITDSHFYQYAFTAGGTIYDTQLSAAQPRRLANDGNADTTVTYNLELISGLGTREGPDLCDAGGTGTAGVASTNATTLTCTNGQLLADLGTFFDGSVSTVHFLGAQTYFRADANFAGTLALRGRVTSAGDTSNPDPVFPTSIIFQPGTNITVNRLVLSNSGPATGVPGATLRVCANEDISGAGNGGLQGANSDNNTPTAADWELSNEAITQTPVLATNDCVDLTSATATTSTVLLAYQAQDLDLPGAIVGRTVAVNVTWASSANFDVAKNYIPTNSGPAVTVALACTSGTVTVVDATADQADSANFTIAGFSAGATCTATETAPAGFNNITGTACTAKLITDGGTQTCTLTNRFNVEAVLFGTAFVGGAIRHVDVDAASEDATWHFQNAASTLHPKGILVTAIDDGDDATTSLHTVCLFANGFPAPTTPALTDADWIITSTSTAAGAAGPPTTNNKAAVIRDFDFNDDGVVDYRANCVEWRSAQPGDQTIVLDLPAALEPPDKFYFDGGSPTGSQPLVKQWNFPQSTKIVGNATGTFGASGYVGLTNLSGNTANTDVSNWTARDALTGTTATAIWTRPNVDSSTITVTGSAFTSLPGPGQPNTRVLAAGTSFIDYALGSHNDASGGTHYSGPLDGVQQRYALSATSCGSVRLENPVTGVTLVLSPGQSTPALSPPDNAGVWLSSDKGTAFSVLPTSGGQIPTTAANATCQPGQTSVITITSQEDRLLRTDRIVLATETITVNWQVGPGHGKQPDLAWAQQRKLLEKNWRNPDGTCPYAGTGQFFYVRYLLQQQSVGALSTIIGEPAAATGQDFVIVRVAADPATGVGNSDCISRVIAESQDQGELDATAHVVAGLSDPTVQSIEADFLIWYMKLEDVTVGLVPGARSGHNSGALAPALTGHTNADAATGMVPDDTTARTANVSADVLARVRVRGWTVTDNCPVRAQGVDSNGGLLPANRCVFPDDWLHMMGGTTAATNNPQSDIWGLGNCGVKEAGPFSLLDPTHNLITDANVCGDSKAPHVAGGFRETVLGNGAITNGDAPVPSALVALTLTGSGFLRPAAKTDIYPTNNNTFYVTHLPSDPWIDVGPNSNYFNHWNTWGLGAKTGIYTFWTSLADRGLEVVSCGGASTAAFAPVATSSCPATGVLTGGYRTLSIFTDNHGEAMVWINGDANLTFTGCLSSASTLPTPLPGSPGVSIKTISGNFCRPSDIVGSSTVSAVVDYPDKHSKHYALLSNSVTVTWTWGGSKTISVTPSAGGQINRVQFNATDRDGFCSPSPSLHKVLGEAVTFLIDSGDGTIIVVSNAGIIAANGRSASTTTVRSTTADVCIAWVDILSTLFRQVNVFITAFDPEGTVAFDTTLNLDSDGDGVRNTADNCPADFNPDQADADGDGTGDACEADADNDGIEDGDDNCPAVFNPDQADSNGDGEGDACEADSDNDGVFDDEDNCPTDYNPDQADADSDGTGDACEPPVPSEEVIWGDVDCSGSVTIGDAQKIARALIGLAITQAAGCTAINATVAVTLDGSTRDRKWGDVDCSGSVTIGDAQKIARNLIDLPITQSGALCPGINETVSIPA